MTKSTESRTVDWSAFRDLLARTSVSILFVLFSLNLLADFRDTHRLTGLLLLVSEAMIVVLMVFRRRARWVDRSWAAAAVTAISVGGPPLLRPIESSAALVADSVTATITCAGLLLVIVAKYTLGRSFGIVPANRGVVAQGPYQFMRHPIYDGYLITHVSFVFAHPSARNITLALVADIALVVRALMEERILQHDETYREYCQRVSWHLLPGVF